MLKDSYSELEYQFLHLINSVFILCIKRLQKAQNITSKAASQCVPYHRGSWKTRSLRNAYIWLNKMTIQH